jgi:hypothetical protein
MILLFNDINMDWRRANASCELKPYSVHVVLTHVYARYHEIADRITAPLHSFLTGNMSCASSAYIFSLLSVCIYTYIV